MNVLARLYRYLRRYRGWALTALASMVIFAATQTLLIALIRPLFDDVLSPPRAAVAGSPAGDSGSLTSSDQTRDRII